MTEDRLRDLHSSSQTHLNDAQGYFDSAQNSGPNSQFYRSKANELKGQAEYEQDLQVYFIHLENVKQKYENYNSAMKEDSSRRVSENEYILLDAYEKLIDEASMLLKKFPQAENEINQTLYSTFESLYYSRTEIGNAVTAKRIARHMMDKGIPKGVDCFWRAKIGQVYCLLARAIKVEHDDYIDSPKEALLWFEFAVEEAATLVATYDRESNSLKKVEYFSKERRKKAKQFFLRMWDVLKKKMEEYPNSSKSSLRGWEKGLKEVLATG